MSEFLAALGLVFVIEGLIFAALPEQAKKAMLSVLETPDGTRDEILKTLDERAKLLA